MAFRKIVRQTDMQTEEQEPKHRQTEVSFVDCVWKERKARASLAWNDVKHGIC